MDRRGFLSAMLSACAAPAIVRASSLMPIVARSGLLIPYHDTIIIGSSYGRSGLTNWAELTDLQKTLWSQELWKHARNSAFVNRFCSDDALLAEMLRNPADGGSLIVQAPQERRLSPTPLAEPDLFGS